MEQQRYYMHVEYDDNVLSVDREIGDIIVGMLDGVLTTRKGVDYAVELVYDTIRDYDESHVDCINPDDYGPMVYKELGGDIIEYSVNGGAVRVVCYKVDELLTLAYELGVGDED